jgi:hypothetical protein
MAASDGLLAIYYCEEDPSVQLDDSSGNGNTVIPGVSTNPPTQDAVNFKQGSYSILGTRGAQAYSMYRGDADLLGGAWPAGTVPGTATAYTVGAWIRIVDRTDIQSDSVLRKGDALRWFALDLGGGVVSIRFTHKDSGGGWHEFDYTPSANGWYHLVQRWQGDTDDEVSFWVDGVKQGTTHTVATHEANGNDWSVTGSGWAGVAYGYDEVFVFNRALSDTEIPSIVSGGFEAFISPSEERVVRPPSHRGVMNQRGIGGMV